MIFSKGWSGLGPGQGLRQDLVLEDGLGLKLGQRTRNRIRDKIGYLDGKVLKGLLQHPLLALKGQMIAF